MKADVVVQSVGHPGGPGGVTVRYWAGARAAAGVAEEVVRAEGGTPLTVGAVVEALGAERPDLARVLAVCSYLVDGVASPPETVLGDGLLVEVLPPFAGG